MKRKSIFTLGTLLGVAALIGGTFASVAAWAVTDNADPFGIQITPNDHLDVSGNDIVTLEWGATKTLADITGLQMGQEVAAGVVDVKATTGKNGSFTGNLSVTLTTTATGENKLIDYLTVDVYSGATKGATPFLSVPYTQSNQTYYTANADKEVTSGTDTSFCFYVSLQAGINPTVYNAIKTQIVTLTVDWGKGSAIQEATSSTVYFKAPASWGEVSGVKVYSWNASGASSANFPGVLMTLADATNKIYTAELETGYNNVIFSKSGDPDTKTVDLVYTLAKPYYNQSAWADAPELDTTELDYYLVGDVMGWATEGKTAMEKGSFTPVENGPTYTYKSEQFTFSEGNKGVKVLSSGNVWYGENGQTDSNNFVMNGAGKYTFYFNPSFGTGAIHAEYAEL